MGLSFVSNSFCDWLGSGWNRFCSPGSSSCSFQFFGRCCNHYENLFRSSDLHLICPCCEGQIKDGPCSACQYAVGFHVCRNPHNNIAGHRWRPGTLTAGRLCKIAYLRNEYFCVCVCVCVCVSVLFFTCQDNWTSSECCTTCTGATSH